MTDIARAFAAAFRLVLGGDPELVRIVLLSLRVSLLATALAFALAAPVGAALAACRFRGRTVVLVTLNALLGLPPVVVGLAVYLLLSRSGPLGGARAAVHACRHGDRPGGPGRPDRRRPDPPRDRGALGRLRRRA